MKKIFLLLLFCSFVNNVLAFEENSIGEMYRSMNYYYSYNDNMYVLEVNNIQVAESHLDTYNSTISLYHVDEQGKKSSEVLLVNGDSSSNANLLSKELGIDFRGTNNADTILREIQNKYNELSDSEKQALKKNTQSSLPAPKLVFTIHNNKVVAYGDNEANKKNDIPSSALVGQLIENTTSEHVTATYNYNYNIHIDPTYVKQDQESYDEDLQEIAKYIEENCSNESSYEKNKAQCDKNAKKAGVILNISKESYDKYNNKDANKEEDKAIKEQYDKNQTVSNIIVNSKVETNDGAFISIETTCQDLYGGSNGLGNWLKNAFNFVKYVGLALVVVLTTMDFLKVVAGEKDDGMKTAFTRFTKRCIALFLLFLAPVLIEFAFNILEGSILGTGGTPVDVCIDYIK